MDKVQKIREEIEKRYEYWKEKESNSHSIESEIRMSECQHLLLMVDSLQEEPVSKRFAFKAIPRLLEMIEPTDRAKAYIAKLADALEVEGYHTDAKIVRENLKIMNGEKVPMATMDEEPVSEDLEKASKEWLAPQLDKSYANYGEVKMMELTHFDGYAMLDAIEFGAKWQKEKEYTCYEEAFEDGAKWQKAKDKSTTEDLGEYINELSKQFPEVSFAKLSRIAVRVAKWQIGKIEEALLSEVLPCFMHGGEAGEVVAKLDEVLNKKK